MDEPKEVLVCYIGDEDPFTWMQSDYGKTVLMPELLVGCEEVLYNEVDEVKCARIEAYVRRQHKAFDFNVRRKDITDTLDKIMEWSLDTEEYEMCQRVKNLYDYIDKQNQF